MPGCVAPNTLVFTLGRPHAQADTARIGELQGRHFGRAVAYGKFGYPDALVLKMDTQKGESGGPLFDSNGRFIGMVVSTLTDANGNLINVAHAVPATAIAKFLCEQTKCDPQWVPIAKSSVDHATRWQANRPVSARNLRKRSEVAVAGCFGNHLRWPSYFFQPPTERALMGLRACIILAVPMRVCPFGVETILLPRQTAEGQKGCNRVTRLCTKTLVVQRKNAARQESGTNGSSGGGSVRNTQ